MASQHRALLVAIVVLANGPLPPAPAATHNGNAPVDFSADHMEVHDAQHSAFLTGAVRAVQQDMTITADRMTSSYSGSLANSSPVVHRLDANGHVVVTRPSQIAHGDFGIYDVDQRLITLIGHVTLDRLGANASTVRGSRLVVNLHTNQASMDGDRAGGGEQSSQGGRVSGRFSAPQHKDVDTDNASPADNTSQSTSK